MPAHVIEDADYLPFKLDLERRRVLLLQLTHAQRAAAAFLDERALPPQPNGVWCPLSLFGRRASEARLDLVFHIGHCGSTLLSRLLQTWPELQVLREPLPLRTLALAERVDIQTLQLMLGLWSRPQAPCTRVLIKATSSCNDLIAPIMETSADSRAILLDMPLTAYLATLLKSEDSIADARFAAPARLRYLATRIGSAVDIGAMNTPQWCAAGWLAERVRFADLAADAQGSRVLRVDFHRLLSFPSQTLGSIARHLDLDESGVAAAIAAPAWQRYSKATEHRYGKQDREHDLALAQQRFGAAIETGVRWVDAMVERYSVIAAAARPE